MRVGVIGCGAIGGYLARALAKLGHTVSIANSRGPESLRSLALEMGVTPLSVAEVVLHQELLIVSIPEKAILDLPPTLFDSTPPSTVIIDAGNYHPFRDGAIEALESRQFTESEWVAHQIHRPVVKVFNSIMARSLSTKGVPAGHPHRIALPVAGDDAKAKGKVIALVESLGFDGVDAGQLGESWKFQPGTPAYCMDLEVDRLKVALGKANWVKSAVVRDATIQRFFALPKGLESTAEEMMGARREVLLEHYGEL